MAALIVTSGAILHRAKRVRRRPWGCAAVANLGWMQRRTGLTLIYSRKHDFLFIKGKKVAGTSIEIALASICGPDDIIAPITPVDEFERLKLAGRGAQNYSKSPEQERNYLEQLKSASREQLGRMVMPPCKFRPHMSLHDFAHLFGSIPSSRIFCAERSPYAKIISAANMSRSFEQYKLDGGQMMKDSDALKKTVRRLFRKGSFKFCKNISRYRGPNGELNIRTLRYESLAQDFDALMVDYGVVPPPALPHVKQGGNSNAIEPRDIFTREQLDIINDVYAEEFDTFGYERV